MESSSTVNFNQTQAGLLGNMTFSSNETFNQTYKATLSEDHILSLTFVAILTILGVVGNTHCLVFYTKNYRQSKRHLHKPYTVFIISLTILDLFACVFILPLDIVDMSSLFTLLSEELCRTFRFLQSVVHMSSILHICVISIYCLRQVGFPHSTQLTARLAITVCIAANSAAILTSIPVILLSGYSTTTKKNQQGLVCKLSEEYADTCFPKVYLALIFFLFLISFLVVLSSNVVLIYCQYKRNKEKKINRDRQSAVNSQRQSTIERRVLQNKIDEDRLRKNTRTLIIIVVIYFMTYMYFLIIAVLTFSTDFAKSSDPGVMSLYRLLARFPFINHVINPLVYGCRDGDFRKNVKQFFCKCKRKS